LKKSIKSLFILLKKSQAVVQKTSRKNVTWTVLNFSSCCLFDGSNGWKNHSQLKRTALKLKNKKHMHSGKELQEHLSRERTLELRQWCTTSRECSVRLDKGRKSESS